MQRSCHHGWVHRHKREWDKGHSIQRCMVCINNKTTTSVSLKVIDISINKLWRNLRKEEVDITIDLVNNKQFILPKKHYEAQQIMSTKKLNETEHYEAQHINKDQLNSFDDLSTLKVDHTTKSTQPITLSFGYKQQT